MIELIRDARAEIVWITTEQMILDLKAKRVVLRAGDRMIVTDEKPKLVPFVRRSISG
jgi:hypothetical protein